MNLKSRREFENTRKKLQRLESHYAEVLGEKSGDPELRQAELDSVFRLINQFKEDLARYEAHQPARH